MLYGSLEGVDHLQLERWVSIPMKSVEDFSLKMMFFHHANLRVLHPIPPLNQEIRPFKGDD